MARGLLAGRCGRVSLRAPARWSWGAFGSDSKDGFAEAVDAVGGGFEGLGGGIVRIAGDDDLQRVMGEERGGEAVGGGEEAVLRGDAGEGFERFFWRSRGSGRRR